MHISFCYLISINADLGLRGDTGKKLKGAVNSKIINPLGTTNIDSNSYENLGSSLKDHLSRPALLVKQKHNRIVAYVEVKGH